LRNAIAADNELKEFIDSCHIPNRRGSAESQLA